MNALGLGKAAMQWVLWNSAGAAVIVLLVLVGQYLLGSRISSRWRYNLWLLVIVRLVLPTIPVLHVRVPSWARAAGVDQESGAALRSAPGLVASGDVEVRRALAPPINQTPLNPVGAVSDAPPPTVEMKEGDPESWNSHVVPPSAGDLAQIATSPPEPPVIETPKAVQPVAPDAAPQLIPAVAIRAPSSWNIPWGAICAVIWVVGALIGLLRLACTSARLCGITKCLNPISDPSLHELLGDCCDLTKLPRLPLLLAASPGSSPALVGVFRPRLLLPVVILKDFDRREITQILLHELAHLKRYDVAVNCLLSVLQSIHWFNPLIWLAFSRMRAERELACDEAVLRLTPQREYRTYGCTMLKLLEALSGGGVLAGALGVVQHKALMHRRIAMIARFDPQKRSSSATGMVLSLFLVGAAVVSAVRAQDAPARQTGQPPIGDQQVNGARAALQAASGRADPQNIAPPAENVPGSTTPVNPGAPRADLGDGIPPLAQQAVTPGPGAAPATTPSGAPTAIPALTNAMSSLGQTSGPQLPGDLIRTVEDPTAVQANAKTTEKLKKSQPSQFNGVPLRDVLSFFADAGGIDIVLDDKSLSGELGVDASSAPVTMVMHEPRPLEQVLQLALRLVNPQIDYALVNGVVFVSSRNELARHVVTRVYEVGGSDPAELTNMILKLTGPGVSVSYFSQKLVVTAPEPRQRDVGRLLAMLGTEQHQVGQPGGHARGVQTVTKAYALKYANALGMAGVLSNCSPSLKVVADERTNSLVVTGSSDDQYLATQVLQRLDQPGKEVGKPASGEDMLAANDLLNKMRSLAEESLTASKEYLPSHPKMAAIHQQLDRYGGELDRLASQLEKAGREADVAKLRSQIDEIKSLLAPVRSEQESPPAVTP